MSPNLGVKSSRAGIINLAQSAYIERIFHEEVAYGNELPEIDLVNLTKGNVDDLLQANFHKSKDYKREEEYRYIINTESGGQPIKFNSKSLTRVILGPYCIHETKVYDLVQRFNERF